jgi:hypothetical protein
MPGWGTAGGVVAVVIGASAVTACGTARAGPGGAGSQPASGQAVACNSTPAVTAGRPLTLGKQDDGKTLCVRTGTTVAVYLQGTAARRWSPIRTASPALKPVANGRLMLRLGVTGAFFKAVKPGVATVTSSLASCPGGESGGTASPGGAPCRMGTVFRVTLVVL